MKKTIAVMIFAFLFFGTLEPIRAEAIPTPTKGVSTLAPTVVPSPTRTPVPGIPYPSAPLCSSHDNSGFHALWNSALGCHYDHEHGTSPFVPEVAAAFPGFDLFALLGNVQVGHTNPSSPMENTHKHGGMKWQVSANAPQGCAVGFEGGTVAIDAYAIQYHDFGRQDVEFEVRNHSTVGVLRQCKSSSPADKGYIFFNQIQEYGERVMPYQGMVLPYPDNFQPEYNGSLGQYFTTECFGSDFMFGGKFIDCRPTYNSPAANLSVWTSKPTGSGARPPGSTLFTLLFRSRQAYMRLDASDLVYPFTWRFVCGGATYNPAGCKYNNSDTTVSEIAGVIPAGWDGLAGWDTDPRAGRVSAFGYVTRYGVINFGCLAPGTDCHPIKLVGAFVGKYSSEISAVKVSNPTPLDTPSRNIYFCAGVTCSETDTGAVPSGWIGQGN